MPIPDIGLTGAIVKNWFAKKSTEKQEKNPLFSYTPEVKLFQTGSITQRQKHASEH